MPRSRAHGTPLRTTLPRGAPDCLAGLVFITTGTMETLKERELVDLVEGYGGEVRGLAKSPIHKHWDRCNYLIRGYDGANATSFEKRELIDSDKVKVAEKRQRKGQPLTILENEMAVFDLIVRKTGGAASSSSSVSCLDPKPKTLVVVHGLHPGYASARKHLYEETLKLMQQAPTSTAFAVQPPPPPSDLPPSDLLLPPPVSPTLHTL